MNTIYLTREITNEEGYIDQIDKQIRGAIQGEPLLVLITCPGGDVHQGARLQRAIMQHDGLTKATVIGIAASMAGVLLGAFDEVEIDEDAEIMLHKAHIPDLKLEDYTKDQIKMCERFNVKSYNKLAKRGVNIDFLDDVFLGGSIEDYWLTASEAEEMGIGKVTKVERNEGKPSVVRLAAKLVYENFKNRKMGILDNFKAKTMGRELVLPDGKKIVFVSNSKLPKIGDKLTLIGDGKLKGKLKLTNELVADIDEEDKVTNLEEVPAEPAEGEADKTKELEDRIKAIEDAVAMIIEKLSAGEGEGGAAMKNEQDEELEAKLKAVDAAKATIDEAKVAVDALLKNVIGVAKEIKGSYVPPKSDNKHEPLILNLENSMERAEAMNRVINSPK